MRRLDHAAVLGLLVLAACSEQSTQTPTSPADGGPAFDKGVPCPTTNFPIDVANQQITGLYPAGAQRSFMLSRAFDISKKWSKCKVADPQEKVGEFVQQLLLDFAGDKLTVYTTPPTTEDRVNALISTMFSGVGLSAPDFPLDDLQSGGDVGVGLFTPGTPLLVRTSTNNAGTRIAGNAFTENTVISIFRLTDQANPLETDQFEGFVTQFPPFYEIIASNASGNHTVIGGAPVGICVDDAELSGINDVAIGHNDERGEGPEFEILPPISLAEFASLQLACTALANPESSAMLRRHGPLGELALGAWQAAQAGLTSLFLPVPAQATVVGKTGVGGRTSSYSPFGIVDQNPGFEGS
jgi:hypothetical protein